MTDEARIEQLTELARRVWPGASPLDWHHHGDEWQIRVDHETSEELHRAFEVFCDHPRALEALEAALMTLADPEAKTITRASFAEAVEQALSKLAESRAKGDAMLREMVGDPPAWAEQLAKEWEDDSHIRSDLREAQVQMECARELRERASKP